jgi:sec-independent protein translocase protein TatC
MACLCIAFLLFGLLFAYYVTIPLANQFLYAFNLSIGENLWSASLYLDYTVVLLLANALAFELCAVLLLCVHYGVISSRWLQAKRRYIYVAIFVVAAVLTPPDVLTQLLLAIPLVIFYEMIVVYARWKALRSTS